MPLPIAPGTKLGQYEVQDFIGQGAMGLVYRAYHPQLERTGAVKVMQAISPDADTVTRFRHEAQAIAKLRHPNIVDVYDFGEFQGTPYMIVEYVPGGSLAAKMGRGKLDRATAVRYLRGIAAGLDYAHSHGVVHRDVKPANVLLTAEDTPVLADFGLAKLLQGSSLKSMTGVTTGTPAYMAPEQVAGRQVGPPADMYSLATIAYEMLTGVIPFDGEALMELLYAQVHREPMPPSSRYPDLGREVDSVIMRGLAKNPVDRWETCTNFVDALNAAMTGAPAPKQARTMVMPPAVLASTVPLATQAPKVAARRAAATVAMPLAAAAPVAPTAPPLPSPVSKVKRRRRGMAAVIAGALIIGLLLMLFAVRAIIQSQPTISLSTYTVFPDESVVVTGAHMPANQAGQVQLLSTPHYFPFRADANGNVATDITVPGDISIGDHLVKLCWNGGCHAQTTLHVISRVGFAPSPTPGTTPTPSPTLNPTPGSTPHSTPGSTPRPTSNPTPSPTPPPPPPPTQPPSPSPKPTPTPNPSTTLNSVSQLGNTTVTFHYFFGGSTTVGVCQNGTCHPAGTVSVSPGANVTVSFKTPVGILLAPLGGTAYVVTGCCGSTNSVTVGA